MQKRESYPAVHLLCGLLLFAGFIVSSHAAMGAPAASFQVTGAVAQPARWTGARLTDVFAGQVKTISYTLKGAAHTAHAVPLVAVIEWSHPRLNPHIKNHLLQFVVEVVGRDGYAADFTLADISPKIGNRKVWIALDQDGKPLDSDDGPVEIVSPDDRLPGRWVHSVATIQVVDMAR